jgi:adenylate cyclase
VQANQPQEERRLVTVLFCDLVGFTPLAEQLDPEEVRDLQALYFDVMSAQIERYGGTVEKYAGDAVLALFGAPVAHEDDAERAVLCALGMQKAIEPVAEQARERWMVEPVIRVGVNTGEVVSGTWNAYGRKDIAVTGDAVNTAARIQAAAEPGEVLVGTETMRLTRRRIRYGERRDVVLKGKAGTVPVYPAWRVRERFGERWETSEQASPLIGRDREMVQLLDVWVRSQGGEGQLVTLIGDAGVGKSRLIAELIDKVAGSSAVRVVRARCLSYGQQISLWLVADLLRSLFGIGEQDGLDEVRARLRAAVPGLLRDCDHGAQEEALDVVGELLGLPPGSSMVAHAGPQIRRQALIRSLRLVLGALSDRAPTVILLEDLHWIDEGSQHVLKEVLSDVPGLRLLVLAAQRPGWSAPWSEWGWTERLTLRPLPEADAALLAGAVLGGVTLSAELERHVGERAGGNPFFVEEMLRSLRDTGGLVQRDGSMHLATGAAEWLPSTLTEVLLARLDRLEADVRSVAQVASVIGRSFGVTLLARVMERERSALEISLSALRQAEIAFPRRGTDLEYVFKHVSMREVAYNTLVQKRRQELHLQTARAMAALYPADEYVEMIAYHYSKTDAHAEAVEWLERAGDRAAGVYANETAHEHYRDAIERLKVLRSEPRIVARLDEKLGSVLVTAGRYNEGVKALERAAAVYREERDLEAAGRATARMGMAHRFWGTPEQGISLVQPMIELLDWSGPSSSLASLYLALAQLLFLTGRYREMHGAAERAGELARAIGDERLLGEAEERRGTALHMLGQPEEARRVIEGALPLVERGGDLISLWRTQLNLGEALKISGDMQGSTRSTERSVEVATRIGNLDQMAFSLSNLGGILALVGDWKGAREALERAVTLSREGGGSDPNALTGLAQLCLWEGNREEASRLLRDALALAEESADRQMQEWAWTHIAEMEVLAGRPGQARRQLEQLASREDAELGLLLPILSWVYLADDDISMAGQTVARAVQVSQGQQVYRVDALRVEAMVLIRQERYERAESSLAEGIELARSLPYPYAEGRMLFEGGVVRIRRGEVESGRDRLMEALAIFRRLGALRDVERTEQELQITPLVGGK